MVRALMLIIAACAVLGGVDRLLGNRLGLGKPFEQAFVMLGPLALSMAGMIVLAPAAANALSAVITPFYHLLGQDPGMFGSFLAIDMGGWQLASALCDEAAVGRFAGILVAATFGCTVSFTIPAGMGILSPEDRDGFARGMMDGLIAMPAALWVGAMLCGIPCLRALWLCVPLALLSGLIALALRRCPALADRAFRGLAALLKGIATVGLVLGAVRMIADIELIPGLTPLEDAMAVVVSICVMLLGSLPLAELLQRFLARPFSLLGERLGIGAEGMLGMLIFYLNVTPGLASLHGMNARARRCCAAFSVCAASALTAHLAFTVSAAPELAMPLLAVKLLGGVLGAALSLCRRDS